MNLAQLRSEFEDGKLTKAAYNREMWSAHQRFFEYSQFLESTNVESIEVRSEGVVFQLREPRLRLWCTPEDVRHVAIANLNFRNYESEEMHAVFRLAKACDIIFDIGANVGLYSIALSQRFPHAKIIAFEPLAPTFKELERNLALNGITNVEALNLGLSDRASEIPFYFDRTVTAASSAAPLGPEFAEPQTLTCAVETLDSFVERTGIRPEFIKCDVEGGELAVFRGAKNTLEHLKPMVFTEMLRKWAARFGYHPNEIVALFHELGYECFVLSEGLLCPFTSMTEETVETNFFFLHSQRHIEMVRFLGLLR
jgi:FkbM family methyltransferase